MPDSVQPLTKAALPPDSLPSTVAHGTDDPAQPCAAEPQQVLPRTMPRTRDARIGVIMLVPDRWRGIWMSRHQVGVRLAGYFEVVWLEASRPWREYVGRTRRAEPILQDVPTDIPGFTVLDPGWKSPAVYRPAWLRDALRRASLRVAARHLRRQGCEKVVLYLWRPEFAWALDAVPADATCYHIGDEYQFSFVDLPNDPEEVALMRRVDHVFIHSPGLLLKKGDINPHTSRAPNGVDYAAYATPRPEPDDLAHIPQPRIGYIGVVKVQLDLQLLRDLATRHSEWSFVLVGPTGFVGDKAHILASLARLPNVYLLGNRPVADLPAYGQHMSVCVMPYEWNDYTNHIYPLKLHEYLATGRPVVATPIMTLSAFGDVIGLASDRAGWETALHAALSPVASTPSLMAARQARAAEHDWDTIVAKIADTIGECVAAAPTSGTR